MHGSAVGKFYLHGQHIFEVWTPMEELGVDYFDNALGSSWLVAIDRYSGYT